MNYIHWVRILLCVMVVVLGPFADLTVATTQIKVNTNISQLQPSLPLNDNSQEISTLKYITHTATKADIDKLKATVGVRDPNKNYGVIINGHGTGYAPPAEEDYTDMIGNMKIMTDVSGGSLPPTSFDLSTEPFFPIVGDQLNKASCTAWSTAYYTLGYEVARDRNWTGAHIGTEDQLLSPEWAFNHANGGMNSGYEWNVVHFMNDVGCARWFKMVYNDMDLNGWGNESAWRDAPTYRSGDYIEIGGMGNTLINNVKNVIATHYPVVFVLDGYALKDTLLLHAGDDTLTTGDMTNYTDLNHVNTVVGYDDSKSSGGEIGAFKCVNSWGTDWGKEWGGNGYYWITYEEFKILASGQPPAWFDVYKHSYEPKLLSVWHNNPTGIRDRFLNVGLGKDMGSAIQNKAPRWLTNFYQMNPEFMCLDITEFMGNITAGVNEFYLTDTWASATTTISSFKIELYGSKYTPGSPIAISGESPEVPMTFPGIVHVYFDMNIVPEFSLGTVPLIATVAIPVFVSIKRMNKKFYPD